MFLQKLTLVYLLKEKRYVFPKDRSVQEPEMLFKLNISTSSFCKVAHKDKCFYKLFRYIYPVQKNLAGCYSIP